ncbi:MAG: Hint domain-containing protein [Alphaproteobacteria bacterium]|nr:Hint domain-containing protein [Alphaproteobacteria bacterium]
MTYTPDADWRAQRQRKTLRTAATPTEGLAAETDVFALKQDHMRNIDRAGRSFPQAGRHAQPRAAKFWISALHDDGSRNEFEHCATADLYLEDICACFGRGALIDTQQGRVAVEDLRPGDFIQTRDNGFQPLRWISSCSLSSEATGVDDTSWPIRIKADALGELRPLQDLVVSPRFRLLSNHPSCVALFGSPETLAPAVDLLDGDTILRVRPSADLLFYNLMFDQHQIITANGLETESYHPGNFGVAAMSLEMQMQMRQIFPHLGGDLNGFGKTARPILRGFEAEVLRVG